MKLRGFIYKSILLNNKITVIYMYLQMTLCGLLLYCMENYFFELDGEINIKRCITNISNLSLIVIVSISYIYMFYCLLNDGKATINILENCGMRKNRLVRIILEGVILVYVCAYLTATGMFLLANDKVFNVNYNITKLIINSIINFISVGFISLITLTIVARIVIKRLETGKNDII